MSLNIAAISYISSSEIAKVFPEFTYQWVEDNPVKFESMLWNLGLDTNYPYERQIDIQHRNRFNEVVICDRWVGNERTCKEWIESGYASQEAIDKSLNNRLLIDLYRSKGMCEVE